MKRNWKLFVCLLAALFALTACSTKPDPEEFPDITQNIGPASTPVAPTAPPVVVEEPDGDAQSIFEENPYLEDEFTMWTPNSVCWMCW